MHETALALRRRGIDARVLAGLTHDGSTGLRARLRLALPGTRFAADGKLGYPTYRAWLPEQSAAPLAARWRPEIVVAHSGHPASIARAFGEAGVPVVVYFHNVEADDLADMDGVRAQGYLANSRFTRARVAELFGVDAEVIVPLFPAGRYRVDAPGDAITFINPHPHKGLELALEIARLLPHHPFLFVKAWTLDAATEVRLQAALSALPNVTLLPPADDMREVYARTRLLLMPSQWEEAWGRVASEAQFSGIPVIGSRRGGIPEAVGEGGVILPHDAAPELWADAIERVMGNEDGYRALSAAALRHAARPEIDPERQIDALLAACRTAAAIGRVP